MVPQKHLGRINGLTYFLIILAQLFAPVYSALLYNDFPLFQSLLVMVVVSGITLIPLFLINIPQTKNLNLKTEDHKGDSFIVHFFKQFVEGFRTIKIIPGILILIGAVLILEYVNISFSIFLPIFIIGVHGGSVLLYSIIYTISFLGVVVGSIVFVIRKYWNPVLILFFLSMIFIFLANLVFILAPYQAYSLMLFANFVKGFLFVFIYSMFPTFIQSNVPNNRLGRVSAINFFLTSLIIPFAPLQIGLIYEVISDIRLTLLLFSIIGIISIIALYIVARITKIKYRDYKVLDSI